MKNCLVFFLFLIACSKVIEEHELQIKLIRHRGAYNTLHPENSLQAVNSVNFSHYQGVEVDVRISLDSCLFIFHDTSTGRLMKEDYVISENTYPVLKRLSYSDGSQILTLREATELVNRDKILFVDIKDEYSKHRSNILNRYLLDSLQNFDLSNMVVTSHSSLFLRDVKKTFSFLRTSLIIPEIKDIEVLIKTFQEFDIDIITLNHNEATLAVINKFHSASINVFVTLIDSRSRLSYFDRLETDGAFVNF